MRVISRLYLALTLLACCLVFSTQAKAQASTFDETVPPGRNFDKADFRLWLPKTVGQIRAIAVLLTGSNGDGRPQVEDPVWQAFATRHGLALLGCRITDKPHEQGFIEEYVNVSQGSGQALLDAIGSLAKSSQH